MMILIWSLLCPLMATLVLTVTVVDIKTDGFAVKNQGVKISCSVQNAGNGFATVFKTSSSSIPANALPAYNCDVGFCTDNVNNKRYTVEMNEESITISISGLNRNSDEKWWSCSGSTVGNTQQTFLRVYTPPVRLDISGSGGDLQSRDVSIICKTSNCVYPPPGKFQWFYKNNTSLWLVYANVTSTPSLTSETTCGDSEKIYISTLQLARNTVWPLQPSNVEKTVQFQCRVDFPSLQSTLKSANSSDVQYAVEVTTVTLKDGNTTPSSLDTIEVVSGDRKELTCVTSTSRPIATIVWYIGSAVKQRDTNITFTFTPRYENNNKQIFCKAFNIQKEENAVSSFTPKLDVKVKVTTVTIHVGNDSPQSDDVIEVTENEMKSLTCKTGDSNPAPTIIWYINGIMKQTGADINFVFTPTNDNHNQRIYCKAYNIQPPAEAVVSAEPKLFVRVLAKLPSLTNWTSVSPDFFSGEQVALNCKSTPTRPAVTLKWKKETSLLQNVQNTTIQDSAGLFIVKSTLTFTPQKSDNGRHISCETFITNQTPQKVQQSISVWWPPTKPVIPTNSFPWLENEVGRQLNCSTSDYGNPEADVLWASSSIGTPASRILRLPKLTQFYHGLSVSCQLSNKYTGKMSEEIQSQIISLNIMYKPDVFIHISNVERYSVVKNEGESLTAVCSAKGNPVPTVTWKDRTPGSPKLEFTDIDRKDHGFYRCSAKASSSHYSKYDFSNETTLDLTVNYAPTVTVNLNNSDLQENISLQISCDAVGRPYVYVYTSMNQTWGGIQIPNTNKPVNGKIEIKNLQLHDSGIYTCVVNNGIKDRNQQLDQIGKKSILVKVSPKVLLEGTYTIAGAVGTSVNITVPFYSYPEIRFVAFRLENGSEITNSSKYKVFYRKHNVTYKFYNEPVELEGYIAVLHIKDEEVSDFRNYTLVLENGIGPPKEWILKHVSESLPSAPVSFIFTGIRDGVPTFSLVGGFNGGSIQTFVVETAVFGTKHWIEQIKFNETDKAFLTDEPLTFQFNLTGLGPNSYNVRVLTENYKGRIEEAEALSLKFTIKSSENDSTKSPVAAIVGGSSAALVVIFIVGAVFFVRRRLQRKDESSAAINGQHRNDSDSSDDEVMTENLAYVSAGDVVSAADNLYAKPQKGNKKGIPETGDLYSTVNKTKTEDLKNQKKEKKDKDDKKGRNKKQKSKPEDVYENASELTTVSSKASSGRKENLDTNIYENPEASVPIKPKNTNKDGLIYADLAFNDQPKGQKKLVIHGLDSMTEYVEVDFTKKAEPLPESDEETGQK